MAKTVQGVEKVINNLKALEPEILASMKTVIELTLNRAHRHAGRNHGPYAHNFNMPRFISRTGHLVQSIHPTSVKITATSVEGFLAASMEYAQWVEGGVGISSRTSARLQDIGMFGKMKVKGKTYLHFGSKAYPFLFPAVLAQHAFFTRNIKKALSGK